MLYMCYQKLVENDGHEYQQDFATKSHLNSVTRWLYRPNSKPGLCLYGGVGSGKSTMANAIDLFCKSLSIWEDVGIEIKVRKVTAKEIEEHMREEDHAWIRHLRQEEWLEIDDVGTEETAIKIYTNTRYPVYEILNWRCGKRWLKTIISTNLFGEAFERKYGTRLADRIRDTFDMVGYNNPSYRGKFFAHA